MQESSPLAVPLASVVAPAPEGPAEPSAIEEPLLADAVESTPALIIVVDLQGRIRMLNKACELVAGRSREDIVGRSLLDTLVAPEARSVCAAQFRAGVAARLRTPITMTIPLATRTGERRRIEWTFSATVPRHSPVAGLFGIGIDVTERLAGQIRAHRRHADLVRLMSRDMLLALATTLSHEVSQPLSAVLAYIQGSLRILSRGTASEEIAAYLEKAAVQASRAGELARSMRRSLYSPEEVACEPVDVNSAVRGVVALIEADLWCRSTTVDLDLAPELPRIWMTPIALELVLFALFQVSLDAIVEAGRDNGRLRIVTRRSGGRGVEIALTDCNAVAAFSRHSRPALRGGLDGFGLGLSMCRSILRNHGGDVDLQETATGATFLATLPEVNQGHRSIKERADD